MFSPPDGLTEAAIISALAREWQLRAVSLGYRSVGFGSHHWAVTEASGRRWFATVDDLATKRQSRRDPLDSAYGRLRASLAAVAALRDHGHAFAVAPVRTRTGEPLVRLGAGFALALYPYVDGESFQWGEFSSPQHRHGLLDLLAVVHSAPDEVARLAPVEDFTVPHRDTLEAALSGRYDPDCGPYARPAADLLARHAAPLRRLLDRYDTLVAQARTAPEAPPPAGPGAPPWAGRLRAVLTHGEPHPGNTMRTTDGWLLIDWETAMLAPPERDLWHLDRDDGSALDAYVAATGVPPLPALIELYRIQWDVKDLAVDVDRFHRPHPGNADDDQSWEILRRLVTHHAAGSPAA